MTTLQSLASVVEHPSGFDSLANYVGETEFPNTDCLLTQNRDSDSLTRSNFQSALLMLGGESENVEVLRFGHWACGWWEALAVKQNTPQHAIALEIAAGLADYPVVDEQHWSQLQWEEASEYWASISIRERVGICQRFDVSVFAARRDEIPQDDNGSLFDYLSQ